MTVNPLGKAREGNAGLIQGELTMGESRTFIVAGRIITVVRTNRPYAHDLADAYNASMPEDLARVQLWVVGHDGMLKLIQRTEPDNPLKWEPEPGEMEWIKRACAEFLRRYLLATGETEENLKTRFRKVMGGWLAAKPWRRGAEEAA